MSDLFAAIQEAARETIRAAEALAHTSPEDAGRFQRVDDAEEKLRSLHRAIDRRLALGLAVPLTGLPPGERAGWEYDAGTVLRELRADAEALVEAAAGVPPQPQTGPGGEWTAATQEQDQARSRALLKVWRIADRLRQLTDGRLFELARYVDTSAPPPAPPPFKLGRGGRSCVWGGRKFFFTDMQGNIVRQLWRAFKKGTPDVSQTDLLEKAGSAMADTEARLVKLFKDHDAWGILIVPGPTKGTYRLAEPPS
jgi:hypothetical protein